MDPAASTRPPRKRTIARVIAAVLLWLVVGAVLTVLTTWGGIIATKVLSRDGYEVVRSFDRSAYRWPHRAPGLTFLPRATELQVSTMTDIVHYDEGIGEPRDWSALRDFRSGLPFRGLSWWSDNEVRGSWWIVAADGAYVLPLIPRWPAFALNTLFYAAIAWGLWRIPILIRRHRRRTRGLCVKCAYNRAGLAPGAACPECGDVPSPAASVASV